ncbi:hypothetical protein CDV55_105223 [Aspergillus turcosus]|uniref:Ferritin/DPS domain-containing protein n=1 Tax=Aspergillus turcosus TaxID=1245748 RepID=A0A229YX14_9EURO|nr:hypothetical protein CDV55_105223 [Aspergillus turcosus]RLL96076.1 hypothetical protein CFD26_105793 [Aspergillus turcosus]
MSEQARAVISEISGHDLDQWLRPSTFTNELEESIRGHIHELLTGWMFFRKLAADCSRANIALHGFALLWERNAKECMIDMKWLEKYLIVRGGRCKPTSIEAPKYEFPDSPVEPVGPCREAFTVEKKLFVDLERLCTLAAKCQDTPLLNVIEQRFLRKHSKHLKNMGDLLQQVTRVSKQPGLGIYILDAELRKHHGYIPWKLCNDPDAVEEIIRCVTKKASKKFAAEEYLEGAELASMEAGHC